MTAPKFAARPEFYVVMFAARNLRHPHAEVWHDWSTAEAPLCDTLADVQAAVLDLMKDDDGQTVVAVVHVTATGPQDVTDDAMRWIAHDLARAADRLDDVPSYLWEHGPQWMQDEAQRRYQAAHWLDDAE